MVETVRRGASIALVAAVVGGDCAGKRLNILLNEASETCGKILRLFLDGADDLPPEVGQILPGVLHGPRQVHQEVEINWEILCVSHLKLEADWLIRSETETDGLR